MDEADRGRGVGARRMRFTEKHFEHTDKRGFRLFTGEKNDSAPAFDKNRGSKGGGNHEQKETVKRMKQNILSLRMERQHLSRKADESEYIQLYRDMQPGQNVYWNGFGDPPSLSFRAAFNDLEFNRRRQAERGLVKGRFAGGNLGWVMPEDLELFAALYCKPLKNPTEKHIGIFELICREGPLNIQQIKEETGMLVKEITPALHRLQEAFLVYEDQYDGGWDRGWHRFSEAFPAVDLQKYARHEALKILLQRFAFRQVLFDTAMAKSFYKLPEKEIGAAAHALAAEGVLKETDGGYILKTDAEILSHRADELPRCVYAVHRNDFLYKSNEHLLKERFRPLCENLPYDHEPLQYLLIDGEFHGAVVGRFRNGPYDLNDVVCDLPDAEERRDEIVKAVETVNFGRAPARFLGQEC